MKSMHSIGSTAGLWKRLKHGRPLSQAVFLALTVWISIRMLSGVGGATVERYCPFGGVETLVPWINKTGTLCSLSTMNISILAGVLIITLLLKRVFCSHVCPMGTVLEWIGMIGRKIVIGGKRIPERLDKTLKWLKYPALVLIVLFTVRVGELVFRDFDPYYVLFTAAQGHGIYTYGMWITSGIIIAGLLMPLSFCKYLCPLGACLAPVGKLGIVRISRSESRCTECGACDASCEWGVKVSESKTVTSAECSNCQDCIRACPEPDALTLALGKVKS